MYVHVYSPMHVYLCAHSIPMCKCICLHSWAYICVCKCIYACICICVYIHMHMCSYVHVCFCTFLCMCVPVASPGILLFKSFSGAKHSFLLILISPKTVSLSSVSQDLKNTPTLHLHQTGCWRRHRPVSTNLLPCRQQLMAKMTIQVKPGCASFFIFSLVN